MKKTIIYLCACALWGMMVATSCSDNLESSVANSDTRSVIIDKNIFAVKGCINVKLAKTTTRALSSAPMEMCQCRVYRRPCRRL